MPGNGPLSTSFKQKFTYFCQKVLPLVYDESLSYYEVLCKLTDFVHTLASFEDDIISRLDAAENVTNVLWPEFQQGVQAQLSGYEQKNAEFEQQVKDELQQFADVLDDIKNGNYVDLYLDSIKAYIDDNLKNFVADIVKFVSFGLTNDGHFAAYIPETWRFLTFSTITDPESPLYNHLVCTY